MKVGIKEGAGAANARGWCCCHGCGKVVGRGSSTRGEDHGFFFCVPFFFFFLEEIFWVRRWLLLLTVVGWWNRVFDLSIWLLECLIQSLSRSSAHSCDYHHHLRPAMVMMSASKQWAVSSFSVKNFPTKFTYRLTYCPLDVVVSHIPSHGSQFGLRLNFEWW